MSEPMVVKKALEAVRGDDLEEARGALMEALTEYPERLDLVHTLAIIELQVGRPDHALDLTQKASALALERRDPGDLELLPLLLLAQGAAHEELNQPAQSLQAYEAILNDHPGHPLAAQGKGHLLLAWGQLERGLETLQAVVDAGADDPRFIEASQKLIAGVRAFLDADLHPSNFADAHRGSTRPSSLTTPISRPPRDGSPKLRGCAAVRTGRWSGDRGRCTPLCRDTRRPDPSTGQAALVGDQPMVVAVAGHEVIAQAPIVLPGPAKTSSYGALRCRGICCTSPSNSSRLTRRRSRSDRGRLVHGGFDANSAPRIERHSITDPMQIGPHTVRYDLDCGRAEVTAIEDLLKRLNVLHGEHPIAGVLIGRGFIPRT